MDLAYVNVNAQKKGIHSNERMLYMNVIALSNMKRVYVMNGPFRLKAINVSRCIRDEMYEIILMLYANSVAYDQTAHPLSLI